MKKKSKIGAFFNFIQRENLHRLLMVIVVLILVSAIGLMLFEKKSPHDALWWSIVTLTTVGYGDISPVTPGGRIIGVIIMFLGIGILGLFTATIASIFVEKKIKADRGMSTYDFQNHIIMCEWNYRAKEILREFRSDSRTADTPIVLIADLENKPVDDENLYFVQGSVTEDNLQRANLQLANTVVILGNDNLDAEARDAKVVLSTLTVESLNPNAYTIVELVDEKNARHCERAHADEIIVSSEFSSKLISSAAKDHGISKVLSELLSSKLGNDLLKIPVPAALSGKSFLEVFTEMKRKQQATVLALQKAGKGEVISNPPADVQVEAGDALIVIAKS